ncbi:chemotaxis protein CheW [Halosimplex marinum]|uniref:chemotaxis protein CheW n=1 Tax=Halosimplex marinum TaxID=3396620 RepID=UPI003F561E0C
MTDDERMDRARRIREMREGSRPDDEAQDDTTEAEEPDESDDSDDSPVDGSGDTPTDTGRDEPPADTEEDAEVEEDAGVEEDPADDHLAESAADDEQSGSATGDGSTETGAGPSAEEAAEAVANLEVNEDVVGGTGGSADEGDGTMHIPGADVGDVDVDVEEMARQAGLESAESEAGDGEGEPEAAEMGIGAAGRAAAAEADTGEQTRVLEFALGDEQYCLDIEYVEEIVKRETVTRVPNTPDCVEGVVDLRGQITTILDPKVLLDIDRAGSKDLIVVFDPEAFDDQGAVGWVVDDVNQVTPITEDEVNDSPVDQDHINGVVDRDGEFVIWTTPELDLDEVAG